MTSKLSQRAQKLFIQYLRENNLKVTQERLALLDEIFSTGEHLDADELLARMKVKQRKVSRATVYRTLDLLVQCGLVRKSRLGREHYYYEKMEPGGGHHHMVCRTTSSVPPSSRSRSRVSARKVRRSSRRPRSSEPCLQRQTTPPSGGVFSSPSGCGNHDRCRRTLANLRLPTEMRVGSASPVSPAGTSKT